MNRISTFMDSFTADESGVTAVEYGLLAALIVAAIVVSVSATSTSLLTVYEAWTNAVIDAIT